MRTPACRPTRTHSSGSANAIPSCSRKRASLSPRSVSSPIGTHPPEGAIPSLSPILSRVEGVFLNQVHISLHTEHLPIRLCSSKERTRIRERGRTAAQAAPFAHGGGGA